MRIDFDWFHNSASFGTLGLRSDRYSLPRINYKRSIATKIPVRIGLGTSLNLSSSDLELDGEALSESSSLGFGNLVLNLEASVVNKENHILNVFFDQFLPTSSVNGPLTAQSGYGDNYGFQTGLRYQLQLLKCLTLFGDLAYGKYINFNDNSDSSFNSLIYYNELVLDTGKKVNLSMGLLGQNIFYNNFFGDNVNDRLLYLVPGLIVPFGKYNNIQTRLGAPIGISEDSLDFGLQFGVFALI